MAIDPGAIDAALAAAVGDDPALIADLRAAFVESAQRGLAASFGAVRLVALATEATRRPVGDPAMIKRLRQAIARL